MLKPTVIKDWVSPDGVRCAVLQMPQTLFFGGHLCGYCQVGPNHPLYRAEYSDERFLDFDVHGGVTYTYPDLPPLSNEEGVWWIGFDCAHPMDTYNPKDEAFVEKECITLSLQLSYYQYTHQKGVLDDKSV